MVLSLLLIVDYVSLMHRKPLINLYVIGTPCSRGHIKGTQSYLFIVVEYFYCINLTTVHIKYLRILCMLHYCSPTKLLEVSVFSRVCLSLR